MNNIKKNYYGDLEGYFRMAIEILLAALLIFYFLTEVTEIFHDIGQVKRNAEKEKKR